MKTAASAAVAVVLLLTGAWPAGALMPIAAEPVTGVPTFADPLDAAPWARKLAGRLAALPGAHDPIAATFDLWAQSLPAHAAGTAQVQRDVVTHFTAIPEGRATVWDALDAAQVMRGGERVPTLDPLLLAAFQLNARFLAGGGGTVGTLTSALAIQNDGPLPRLDAPRFMTLQDPTAALFAWYGVEAAEAPAWQRLPPRRGCRGGGHHRRAPRACGRGTRGRARRDGLSAPAGGARGSG